MTVLISSTVAVTKFFKGERVDLGSQFKGTVLLGVEFKAAGA